MIGAIGTTRNAARGIARICVPPSETNVSCSEMILAFTMMLKRDHYTLLYLYGDGDVE